MINLLQQLSAIGSQFLQNLDLSLFQNITLGILAIFIPMLVVFLSEKNDDFLKRELIKKKVMKTDIQVYIIIYLFLINKISYFPK